MSGEIADLERVSLRGFEIEQQILIGDWVAVASSISARRANSIYPLGNPLGSIGDAINAGADFLRKHEKAPLFKLAAPVGKAHPLDSRLQAEGYRPEALTVVLTRKIDPPLDGVGATVEVGSSERWFSDRARFVGLTPEQAGLLQEIITPADRPTGFASVSSERGGAQGQATLVDGWLGVFNMFTEPAARRSGMARRILAGLLSWGREQGAERAFLQVADGNFGAQQLYRSAGFSVAYEYRYLRLPDGSRND